MTSRQQNATQLAEVLGMQDPATVEVHVLLLYMAPLIDLNLEEVVDTLRQTGSAEMVGISFHSNARPAAT